MVKIYGELALVASTDFQPLNVLLLVPVASLEKTFASKYFLYHNLGFVGDVEFTPLTSVIVAVNVGLPPQILFGIEV